MRDANAIQRKKISIKTLNGPKFTYQDEKATNPFSFSLTSRHSVRMNNANKASILKRIALLKIAHGPGFLKVNC